MLTAAIVFLIGLAALDLWVGVSNDAVNFFNSAVGSQAAKRRVILLVATVGVVLGALLSSGMMEVARKGIFDPAFFSLPEGGIDIRLIVMIYLGVMTTDVILLDLFNTLGLPTSTTVSIVSELLGAALAVALWKSGGDFAAAASAIHWAGASKIYIGILLSVVVAFFSGAALMFLLRTLFSRDTDRTFKYFGGAWAGICGAALFYFVLFKAGKNVGFISKDAKFWLSANIWYLMGGVFAAVSAAVYAFGRNPTRIFKLIILMATGALAAAFAGNDLVNFIGPTVAGAQAVFIDNADLAGKVATPTWALLGAGAIMAAALWLSNKAKTVSDTEVRLASQTELKQRFSSSRVARLIIVIFTGAGTVLRLLVPRGLQRMLERRTRPIDYKDAAPPYDMLRATMNLTLSCAIISVGTASKLPLSTTYVTFMVAMGAAMGDRVWGRQNADARITGVLVVIGGWFVTGLIAATGAFLSASLLWFLGFELGLLALVFIVVFGIYRLHRAHKKTATNRETVTDLLEKSTAHQKA